MYESPSKPPRDSIVEFIRRNIFRPVTLGIIFLVITAQVLVVLHIHHSKNSGSKLPLKHLDTHRKNTTLKPLKLDKVSVSFEIGFPFSL
jgi:hypothetical protein